MEDFRNLYIKHNIFNNSLLTIEEQEFLALYNYLYYDSKEYRNDSDTLFNAIKKYGYLHKINIENICELSANDKIRPKRLDWSKRNYKESWSGEMEDELFCILRDIRKEHEEYIKNSDWEVFKF